MKRIARAFLGAVIAVAMPAAAFAQAVLLQGSAWTPGHAPIYSGQGSSQPIVTDSGPAGGGVAGLGLSEILQVARPGNGVLTPPYANSGTGKFNAHNCFYDAPITNATGYHFLCLDPNAQGGGLIAYGAAGAAPELPLLFNYNGVVYQFPFTGAGGGNVVGPNSSPSNALTCFNGTSGTLLKVCGAASAPIQATSSGTANAIVLAPAYLPSTVPQDGMTFQFSWVASAPDISAFVTINVNGLTGGPWSVYLPDAHTHAYYLDVYAGQTVTARYSSAASGFVITTPPPSTLGFTNVLNKGSVTIAASAANALALNGGAGGLGGSIPFWVTDVAGYRTFNINGGPPQQLFNLSAIVNGVPGSTLADDTLYAVYTHPISSAFNTVVALSPPFVEFWQTSLGHAPTNAANGFYVLNNSGADQTRLFLGLVYTRTHDITNNIGTGGTIMGNAVYSHYWMGRERFGYQTAQITNTTTSASLGTQATPFIDAVTEGITDSPHVTAKSTVSCTGSVFPVSVTTNIQIGGIGANGAPINTTTLPYVISLASATDVKQIVNEYESAPGMGYYTFQINIAESAGASDTCTFKTDFLASLPQ